MKHSQKFKLKLNICRIFYILLTITIIYLLIKYVILGLMPYFKKEILIVISIFFISSILILFAYYMDNLNKFSKLGKEKIYKELDSSDTKEFKEFGLYITKNYIVCLGGKMNIFRLFILPIDSINAIDTHEDSRYFYKKKKNKNKHKFLSFLKSLIQNEIMFGDNSEIHVFNIISDKKVYSIATSHIFNKRKLKKIEEVANYICENYKDIDWI